MKDMVERLEKATGPDGAIDSDLALLAGWERRDWDIAKANLGWFAPGCPNVMHSEPPRYTRSIDDALTLVPEGWFGSLPINRNVDAWLRATNDTPLIYGRGVTPAIALCIAALKARDAI